jgi:hypothetical protein
VKFNTKFVSLRSQKYGAVAQLVRAQDS